MNIRLYDLAGDEDDRRFSPHCWRVKMAYPDRPKLMDSEQARGAILAFKFWCDRAIHPLMMRVIILDLFARLHDKDKAYFRESREKRFGKTLEEFGADPGRVPRRGVEDQREIGRSAGCLVQAAAIAGSLSEGLSLIGASDSRLM